MPTKGEMLVNQYMNHGNQIYDVSTGEIIDIDQISKAKNNQILELYVQNIERLLKIDGDIEYKLVKNKQGETLPVVNVKENYEFMKVFKVDLRGLLETVKLSLSAKGFLFHMSAYLHFPTNTIVCDGKSPSIKDLCEMLEVKQTKLYEILKELESKDIIKREKINGSLVIYFNPFLLSCGYVDFETYKMFRKSNYNPINTKSK